MGPTTKTQKLPYLGQFCSKPKNFSCIRFNASRRLRKLPTSPGSKNFHFWVLPRKPKNYRISVSFAPNSKLLVALDSARQDGSEKYPQAEVLRNFFLDGSRRENHKNLPFAMIFSFKCDIRVQLAETVRMSIVMPRFGQILIFGSRSETGKPTVSRSVFTVKV